MIRRFDRYELKYLVHVEDRDRIIADLEPHMTPDPMGGSEGYYRVTSLYFDSKDRCCFRAKLEGNKFRRKLRVRVYGDHGDAPGAPATVEIKQRITKTVQKRRVVLPLLEALLFCDGRARPSWPDEVATAIGSEIEYLIRSMALRPACVVGYLRQAFVGSRYEPGLRITFDQMLWSRAPRFGFGSDPPGSHFSSPEHLVMEVKADLAVPLWVTHLLARHGCVERRMSKYCAGLARLATVGPIPERQLGEADG